MNTKQTLLEKIVVMQHEYDKKEDMIADLVAAGMVPSGVLICTTMDRFPADTMQKLYKAKRVSRNLVIEVMYHIKQCIKDINRHLERTLDRINLEDYELPEIKPVQSKPEYMKSSYHDMAVFIQEVTGYDCTVLTEYQMDMIGMSAENAILDIDWAKGELTGDSKTDSRIKKAISNIKESCADTENEYISLCVGGTYDSFNL